ncbi:MAG: aminopeptidase P family protein [Oscillospiraceae bacterium]|nr:aminopeptidase P family protein [Oscillospiraceae bacterium]
MSKAKQLSLLLPDEVDGALITSSHNRRYITGFPSSAGTVLITRQQSYFLTDFRYFEAAQRVITDIKCVEYKKRSDTLRELFKTHKISRLAVEDDDLSCAEFKRLGAELKGVELCGGILDGLLKNLRLVKSPEELKRIEQAQQLTDHGFEYILPRIKVGRTEREIALELEFEMRRQGADAVAFDFIVVSGANSALPHGAPSNKSIEQGDLVTMDFGGVVDGWCSDMTRTVAVGSCSDEQRRVYDTVLKAQAASLAVLRAGLPCIEGDGAARSVIDSAGYCGCFGHGTGHGVGIEIHEAPRMSPMSGDEVLREGSVVTVEPGIYLSGRFGVRIEDMVFITKDGCRDLTKSSKELIVL